MKAKFSLKLPFVSAGLVAALTIAGSALAAFPKEGKVDFTACWSGANNVIAFSKTHIAFSYEMTGTARSNLPDNPFDKHAFRCVGVVSLNEGKVVTGTTFCESVDKDGDKTFSQYDNEGQKVTRTQIGGTGKYEGMQTSITAQGLGPFPMIKPGTFQNCNHQTGTYKMK